MNSALSRIAERRARAFAHVDWFVFFAALAISLLGLVTMYPLSGDGNTYFEKQVVWIALAIVVFYAASIPEYQFLRRSGVVAFMYIGILGLLGLIFAFGAITLGAQNRFDLGGFAIQPSDPAKLVLIVLLAKYFARRHVEIAHFKHIFISGAYALLLCALIFFQPDFGGAIITASIWFGMVLVAGISWRHLLFLLGCGVVAGVVLWTGVFQDYQKERIVSFLHPLADIQGAGYNAYQSTVAVGSGELVGKGIGFGTQSKLLFLPEYQTDFIFAAYAEEWGFVGVLLLFGLFSIVIIRILTASAHASDNFAALFGAGVAIMFLSHFIVHIGMNLGLLPVTGTTVPFMSYGGSHLLTEFLALGVLMGLRRHARASFQVRDRTELIGAV